MAAPTRIRRRADRVKTRIAITRVLSDFGYMVRPDAGDREQQFSCDLHGDGQDNKPSARVYPETNSWYCFACGKSRDNIETVRENKNLGFVEAIVWLEKKYNLEELSWEAGDSQPREQTQREQLTEHLDSDKSFEEDAAILKTLLDDLTGDRALPLEQLAAFWEGFDKLLYLEDKKLVPEVRARAAILGITKRIMEAVRGGP